MICHSIEFNSGIYTLSYFIFIMWSCCCISNTVFRVLPSFYNVITISPLYIFSTINTINTLNGDVPKQGVRNLPHHFFSLIRCHLRTVFPAWIVKDASASFQSNQKFERALTLYTFTMPLHGHDYPSLYLDLFLDLFDCFPEIWWIKWNNHKRSLLLLSYLIFYLYWQ